MDDDGSEIISARTSNERTGTWNFDFHDFFCQLAVMTNKL